MTTGGSENEVKYAGPVSTLMRVSTNKDEDLLSYFDKFKENKNDTTLKEILTDNHSLQANKGKIFCQLTLEHIFGFCNRFKKVRKNFHINLKTNDLQNIANTTLPKATIINVLFDNLYLFVPNSIPSPDTQVLFNQPIKNSFTPSFDSWTTDRKVVNTGKEYQLDIASSVKVNSPRYLIPFHQNAA